MGKLAQIKAGLEKLAFMKIKNRQGLKSNESGNGSGYSLFSYAKSCFFSSSAVPFAFGFDFDFDFPLKDRNCQKENKEVHSG